MIGLWRKWRAMLRQRRNRASLSSCGHGTQLIGVIEKRAPGASIVVGHNCLVQGQLVAERPESRLELGDRVLVGGGTVIDCALSITVEDDVLISYECTVADSDNHSLYPELRRNDLTTWMDGRRHDWSNSAMAPIRICRGAWIGARSIILKGVTVGPGAVVGMGSVVTRDVPARVVAAGNPAQIIREIGPPPSSGPAAGEAPTAINGTLKP